VLASKVNVAPTILPIKGTVCPVVMPKDKVVTPPAPPEGIDQLPDPSKYSVAPVAPLGTKPTFVVPAYALGVSKKTLPALTIPVNGNPIDVPAVCKLNPARPPAGCHVPSPLKNDVFVPPAGTTPILEPPLYILGLRVTAPLVVIVVSGVPTE